MVDKPVIDIKNVWFSFNREPVLQDVQFTLYHKEFLAMIGPNGGGKTTLLKLMMGLLQADSGEIRIFGQSPNQAAHRIGYVPQDIHINKNFPISVLDVVLMGRLKSGISWSHRKKDDRIAAVTPSPFLEEIPDDLVTIIDSSSVAAEDEGIDYFAAIKERLK